MTYEENAPKKKYREVSVITAEITELDEKIRKLNKIRDGLMREHDGATEDRFHVVF